MEVNILKGVLTGQWIRNWDREREIERFHLYRDIRWDIYNPSIIKPYTKRIIPNMGLSREGSTSVGNLIIEFEIEFPDTLSFEKINELKIIL